MAQTNAGRSVQGLMVCGFAALCCLVGTGSARACSWGHLNAAIASAESSLPGFNQPRAAVPPAGPIIVVIECTETTFCQTDTAMLHVGPEAAPLEGDLEVLRGAATQFLVWSPAEPLEHGEHPVEVSWDFEPDPQSSGDDNGGQVFQVTVDPASRYPTLDLDDVLVELSAAGIPVGPKYCCSLNSCFDHCTTEYEVTHATLRADTTAYAPDHLALQSLAFRLVPDGSVCGGGWGLAALARTSRAEHIAAFAEPADEYCATLEGLDLARRIIRRRRICRDADPTVEVGALLATTHEPLDFGGCWGPPVVDRGSEPPPALLYAWCDGVGQQCDTDEYCADPDRAVHYKCANATLPPHEPAADPPLASEMPWAVDPPVIPPFDCASIDPGTLSGVRDAPTRHAQACSVSWAPRASRGSTSVWVLLGLMLSMRFCRRRALGAGHG